ncbi:MAG: Ig-like domain-containing protein [Lachnospiraceae bacterium]|nr:Ig-like domain-containing protein [Lachnospiraceae bacterium]
MAETSKDFLVSTADVAFMVNGQLAFTGTTSLNTSISVSMEDQEITGGKGNKTLYKYKYGRKLAPSIEMAEWNLAYIAANAGTKIFEGAKDVFAIAELVSLTGGVGTLSKTPVGEVFVELADGSTATAEVDGNQITVAGAGDTSVRATYRYNATVKRITIDAESTPLVGELILTADKHNNLTGKVGEVQIDVPSFQLSGTFDISLEASGSTTTKLDGDALAVEDASCTAGPVYAYITEVPSVESAISVSDIAATPAVMELAANDTKQISIVGIKGGMYSNVGINPATCEFTVDDTNVATIDTNGVVTAVATGDTFITVTYGDVKDVVKVTVK